MKIKPVSAHCDIPCGIYETDTARHAASTCLTLASKLAELDSSDDDYYNQLTRIVMSKDEHAQKCKQQLYILWSDYFKPPHLDKYPDLHERFWWATKQCSQVRQSAKPEPAEKLVKLVDELAQIFSDCQQA